MIIFSTLLALAGTRERCVTVDSSLLRPRIRATEALAHEVVLVPETLADSDLGLIATALHADISHSEGDCRIIRRSTTDTTLRKTDRAWMRAQIGETIFRIDALARQYAAAGAGAPYEVLKNAQARFAARTDQYVLDTSGMQAQELTPVARLLVGLLRGLSDSALEAAAPGSFAVFSTAPVGVERPLMASDVDLAMYDASEESFVRWSDEATAQGTIPEAYRWAFPHATPRTGPHTLMLRIDRRSREPSFNLQVFDSTGSVELGLSLSARGSDALGSPPRPTALRLGQVALPSATMLAIKQADPSTPEFRALSLDPVAHEPLDRLVRDALLLWGKAKGYDRVVACVPDDLFASVPGCVQKSSIDLDMLTEVLNRAGCESLPMGQTLIIRPLQPLQEEALRIDRTPLSRLCLKAAKGTFGIDDLLDLHASYSSNYTSPLRLLLERPIRDAFGLSSSRNWSVPHPVLAVAGMLSSTDRQRLLRGGRIPIAALPYASCLFPLAQLAGGSRGIASGSDLDRTPTHLLSLRVGPWLQGTQRMMTLVRRVNKGHSRVTHIIPGTGDTRTEEGENLVRDDDFIPLQSATTEVLYGNVYERLDQTFSFYWAETQTVQIAASFSSVAQAGPFALSQRVNQSKTAVPLSQVPGSESLRNVVKP